MNVGGQREENEPMWAATSRCKLRANIRKPIDAKTENCELWTLSGGPIIKNKREDGDVGREVDKGGEPRSQVYRQQTMSLKHGPKIPNHIFIMRRGER